MAEGIQFAAEAKKSLEALLPLQPVALDPQLQHIKTAGGSVDIEFFRADKFEKIVLCTINIFETEVVEATVMAWPDDRHNFPILWGNLTIVPCVMNVPIFDFVPLMDTVLWPDYADTYIEGVNELKADSLELLGDTVLNKDVVLPSKTIYTLSPYRLIANIKEEGVALVPQITDAYIKAYVKLWEKAGPVGNAADLDHYAKKRSATRTLMKGNDPGYPFMIDAFGEEKTHKVFDIIF
ncbi:MAG: hypothetical protein JW832_04080 [Deltaproteobacteria bacterium]|nr:hypothetical protein [Deltaproteobacteria bacterium]